MNETPTEPIRQTQSATADTKTRVLLVDDHELVRDGLRQLLNRQATLAVCGEAASEQEGRELFKQTNPELVIIDLTLPDGSGFELIKWIRSQDPAAKMIVLTMRDELDYGERALRAGALGYVNKQEPARTVLSAIDRVLEGKMFFSEELTSRVLQRAMSPARQDATEDSPVAGLSNRELEVFCLIGQGLTTEEIGERLHLSSNTIGTYRERLKTKLRLKNAKELTHYATLWIAENG